MARAAEDPALGGLWVPDVLQNKVDVYRRGEQEPGDDDVLAAAKELDVAVVAYERAERRPRGVGARADPLLRQLAARRGVDVPTLILRWHADAGHAAIPRSRDAATSPRTPDALSRARAPLAPAERAAIDAIPHLVAGPRNRPATADDPESEAGLGGLRSGGRSRRVCRTSRPHTAQGPPVYAACGSAARGGVDVGRSSADARDRRASAAARAGAAAPAARASLRRDASPTPRASARRLALSEARSRRTAGRRRGSAAPRAGNGGSAPRRGS